MINIFIAAGIILWVVIAYMLYRKQINSFLIKHQKKFYTIGAVGTIMLGGILSIPIDEPPESDPVENIEPYHILNVGNGFGTATKILNVSYFWDLFRSHGAWQLEAWHPIDEEWVSSWQGTNLNTWLDIDRNRSEDNLSEKISLTVTNNHPSQDLYFRFKFGIDLRVKSYVNKSSNWEYELVYPVSDTEDYTVFFNFSDVQSLVQDGVISQNHGVKNIAGKDVFWFMLTQNRSRNPLQSGNSFMIDPNFGITDPSGFTKSSSYFNYLIGPRVTCNVTGMAESISVYGYFSGSGGDMAVGLYDVDRGFKLIGNSSATYDMDDWTSPSWRTFNLDVPAYVNDGTIYYLLFWTDDRGFYSYYTTGQGSNHYFENDNFDMDWIDPCLDDNSGNKRAVYCTVNESLTGWVTPFAVSDFSCEDVSHGTSVSYSIDDDTNTLWAEEVRDTDNTTSGYEWWVTYDMNSSQYWDNVRIYADGNGAASPCKVCEVYVHDDLGDVTGGGNLLSSCTSFSTSLEWQESGWFTNTSGRYITIAGGYFINPCVNADSKSFMQSFCEFDAHLGGEPVLGDTPELKINFAGNLGDFGGPYFLPGYENETTDGPYPDEGYYTNNSQQKEDWMYINCTVINADDGVWLHWYNITDNIWNNDTQLTNTGGDFYEINTSGNITITNGHRYSFDVNASDSPVHENSTSWNKMAGDSSIVRRSVVLGATADNDDFEYTSFYLHNNTKTLAADGYNAYDAETEDQGALDIIPGTPPPYDQGKLLSDVPDETVDETNCSIWTGYFMHENMCINHTNLTSIYYHSWASSYSGNMNVALATTRVKNSLYLSDEGNNVSLTSWDDGKSSITWDDGHANDTFTLYSGLLNLSTHYNISDNNVYELLFLLSDSGEWPTAICNRSIQSFVIFDVPDNATLNSSYSDSDNDNLSDWYELYKSFTNPWDGDTDHDGQWDDFEITYGSDPNNYKSTFIELDKKHLTIRNDGVDYFIWLGESTTLSNVSSQITGFDEASEYVGVWGNDTWSSSYLAWTVYHGDDSGTDATVQTFDPIIVYLTDSGTQSINMYINLSVTYTDSLTHNMSNVSSAKGYNFSCYNKEASTTLSDVNTSIGLGEGEGLAVWDNSTYNWVWYIVIIDNNPTQAVDQWNIVQTKVEDQEVWST